MKPRLLPFSVPDPLSLALFVACLIVTNHLTGMTEKKAFFGQYLAHRNDERCGSLLKLSWEALLSCSRLDLTIEQLPRSPETPGHRTWFPSLMQY